MRIINTYEEARDIKPYCMALGSFDGVHVGHQKLIEILKYNSKLFACESMIYTFATHPRKILRPDHSIYMITNNAQRVRILEELDVDVLFLENFEKIMNLSAEQFFNDILIEKFNAKCIIVGYNYYFGKNGAGNAIKLMELGRKYGIKVVIVPPVVVDDEVVSSSLVRQKIMEGMVDEVPEYLGRAHSIQGKVIHGKSNGRAMGIRTANIKADEEAIIPLKGVYITDTKIDDAVYKSVTNVGMNPTFKGSNLSIETHVLDFEGDLYDKDIEVFFYKRLRGEIQFPDVNSLIKQIKSDIRARIEYADYNML